MAHTTAIGLVVAEEATHPNRDLDPIKIRAVRISRLFTIVTAQRHELPALPHFVEGNRAMDVILIGTEMVLLVSETMIDSDFTAAMTDEELRDGEAHHAEVEQSRKLAMAAGLTKTSDELRKVWEEDRESYLTLLRGAVAAYEQNELVEELLRGAMARLVSVVDDTDPITRIAASIIAPGNAEDEPH